MIITLGEALVDMIEQPDGRFDACLGGSVCNFTQAIALQGLPTTYLNPLSFDKFGDRFHALLLEKGVRLASRRRSLCPTSLAIVSLDRDGSPTYAFHRDSVADRDVSAAELIAGWPDDGILLHTGGLALVPADLDKICAVITAATRHGALISIDANLRPMVVPQRAAYIAGVLRALGMAHIVKVSDEDLEVLGLGAASLQELADTLFGASSVHLIALTRGAQGATLMTRHAAVTLAAPAGLTVVDTVGAGDCFQAGLLAYLQHGGKLASAAWLEKLESNFLTAALRHAIASASINITRSGCSPASWDEVVRVTG
jgi:fructokinase